MLSTFCASILDKREILRSILEDEYTILEAENGKQALEIVDQEAKDMAAIMLDLVMPEMDGTQVLEELNRREVIGQERASCCLHRFARVEFPSGQGVL